MRSLTARIVLSFLALFLAASALLVWAAARQASRAEEERSLQQARTVARLLLEGRFLDPAMLLRTRAIVGAEVIERVAGRVRGTTLPRPEAEDLARDLRAGEPLVTRGRWRVVAFQEGDTALIFAFSGEALEQAKADAVRPLYMFAGIAVAGVIVLGIALGRTLLRPLAALLAGADRVARGDLTREVPVPSDSEFGALAGSFNRMQASLRKQQEDERWAAAGRVAAGIAHDLRNPLTGVQMIVQLLEREEKEPKRREMFAQVLVEVRRLERSIGELMALAAPEPPRRESVALAAVIRDALALFADRARHRGVDLTYADSGAPDFDGDPGRIRRILDNLVANALDATPSGGRVTVTAGRDGPRPSLVVADTGAGIPDPVRARLFEPFATQKSGGTGLGLATVKRLCDDLGATIAVDTSPAGTRFTILFPAPAGA